MTIFRASAGTLSAELLVKRPKFAAVWAAYPKISAEKAYGLVGGEVFEHYRMNPSAYANACALRLSRAFNYGGLPIRGNADSGYRLKGSDGKAYFLRVTDIMQFVRKNFGRADTAVEPNGVDKTASFAGKTGVLVFTVTGWSDATGHVTLWNGSTCGDHCYFTHENSKQVTTTKVEFWELK